MKNRGFTYIETILSLTIFLLIITPLMKGIYYLSSFEKKMERKKDLEILIKKARVFYKRNGINKSLKDVKVNEIKIGTHLYRIDIEVVYLKEKKKTYIYVYK